MKDAAVSRLAKSITQLTLCQVSTSEVDAATKLLDKACAEGTATFETYLGQRPGRRP